jgi:NADH-quinone oxidoreductase subunit C
MNDEQLKAFITQIDKDAIFRQTEILTACVKKEALSEIIIKLKNAPELRFTILSDLFAADFPDRSQRFEVVYNLLSLELNKRLILKLNLKDQEAAPSITSIFASSNWYEREAFDMFGITFEGHPNLNRILTDYGFIGHPLRKDFPLSGYVEVKYDKDLEQVIYEPVNLDQEFRDFDFVSPWRGPENTLPGDEKATQVLNTTPLKL